MSPPRAPRMLLVGVAALGAAASAARSQNTLYLISGGTDDTPSSHQNRLHLNSMSRNGITCVGSRSKDYEVWFQSCHCYQVVTTMEGFGWYPFYNYPFGLGALDPFGETEATAITADGQTRYAGFGWTGQQVNLLAWDFVNGGQDLGRSGNNTDRVFATCMDSAGNQIFGYMRIPGVQTVPFRFIFGHGFDTLGVLPGGNSARAFGCSADGNVWVGDSETPAGTHAYRNDRGAITDLGVLPGGNTAFATAVSGDGTIVVGHSRYSGGGVNYHPFRWTSDTGMVDLGTPVGSGHLSAYANAVSDSGLVIVGESRPNADSGPSQAMVWLPQTGPLLLKNALIAAGYLQGYEPFNFTQAVAVSGDGTVIAGNALSSNGNEYGWQLREFTLAPVASPSYTSREVCLPAAPVQFDATFLGLDPMTFEWTHNGVPVANDPRVTVTTLPAPQRGSRMVLNNPTAADAGTYFICNATNAVGSGQAWFLLNIPTPPALTDQPASTITCGEFTSLAVVFTGTAPAFRWQIANPAAPGGWDNLTNGLYAPYALSFVGTTQSALGVTPTVDAGGPVAPGSRLLRCVVSNNCGTVTSDAATLTVGRLPTIASQPADASTCPDGSASFVIVADSDRHWQVANESAPGGWDALADGLYEPYGMTVSGSTSMSLDVQLGAGSGGGSLREARFRCVLTNDCGPVTSREALLTILPGYDRACGGPGCDPDTNQDGNTDQDDVVYLINVVGGGENSSGIDPDFNQDGNIDQDDVVLLINIVAGGDCP